MNADLPGGTVTFLFTDIEAAPGFGKSILKTCKLP